MESKEFKEMQAKALEQLRSGQSLTGKGGVFAPLLKEFIRNLKAVSVTSKKTEAKQVFQKLLSSYEGKDKSPINIISKNFYPTFSSFTEGVPTAISKYDIFEANNYLLRCIADNIFDYEIKGSGKWENCAGKPRLLITYDIYYPGDEKGLAATYSSYLGGATVLTADITLD